MILDQLGIKDNMALSLIVAMLSNIVLCLVAVALPVSWSSALLGISLAMVLYTLFTEITRQGHCIILFAFIGVGIIITAGINLWLRHLFAG